MQPIQEFNNKIKMGTFSIFASVLTFILVFYYAVVIFMDLRKINPGIRKDDVEFIKTAEEQETQHEEENNLWMWTRTISFILYHMKLVTLNRHPANLIMKAPI